MSDGDARSVVFLDLDVLLETASPGLPVVREEGRRRLAEAGRAGVIAWGRGRSPLGHADVERMLRTLGLDGFVEAGLVVDAASLPVPPSDPRIFAIAAALAGSAIGDCRFLTASPARAALAERAGMQVEVVASGGAAFAAAADEIAEGVALIDEDTGPTFVLEGRIVTMTRRRPFVGRLAVRRGRIVALVDRGVPLPPSLRAAPLVPVDGTIYPGLIDLHNHYVYNVAPLWRVPRRYENRTQWADVASKNAEVSLPVKLLAGWPPTARAVVRYVEAKALIGGTTTGQGIRTQVRGGIGLFRGAMRNVESTDDARLPDSATLVPTIGRRAEDFAAFRAALRKRQTSGGAYFYHLAEGTNDLARRTYLDLHDNGLLQPPLAAIHALALHRGDLRAVRDGGAKVVWSPFSNLLLYGRTLDLRALLASRARFAIGSDWTPSGSRNLLQELKVARHVVAEQGVARALPSERLVRAVTADAAGILGWSPHVGALREGALADLVVIAGAEGDDYDRLIDATERDVRLVVVHGVARYGDRDLLSALGGDPGEPLEPFALDGGSAGKAFRFGAPGSAIDRLTLADATRTLRDAFDDLHAFRDVVEQGRDALRALGLRPEDEFTLLPDNEDAVAGADGEGALADAALGDLTLLPPRLELDGLAVGGADYWSRVADQPNIEPTLGERLRAAYEA